MSTPALFEIHFTAASDQCTRQKQIVQRTAARQSSQWYIRLSADNGTCSTKVVLTIREPTGVQSQQRQLPVLLRHGPPLSYCQRTFSYESCWRSLPEGLFRNQSVEAKVRYPNYQIRRARHRGCGLCRRDTPCRARCHECWELSLQWFTRERRDNNVNRTQCLPAW